MYTFFSIVVGLGSLLYMLPMLVGSGVVDTQARTQAVENKAHASRVLTKAEIYNAEIGQYPTIAQLASPPESLRSEMELSTEESQRLAPQPPTASQPDRLGYSVCRDSGAEIVGIVLKYWDAEQQEAVPVERGYTESTTDMHVTCE